MAGWMGYSVVSAFTIDVAGNALVPMFGVIPATFATIVPNAEWQVQLAPLSGEPDVGGALTGILPYLWSVGDPGLGFSVRLIPTQPPDPPNTVRIRVTKPDLVTPAAGAAFIVGFALWRREGMSQPG